MAKIANYCSTLSEETGLYAGTSRARWAWTCATDSNDAHGVLMISTRELTDCSRGRNPEEPFVLLATSVLILGPRTRLSSLLYGLNAAKTKEALADMISQAQIVTWRGVLTKILTSVYEENEGWEMNAMMLDGCLYLEQNKTAAPKRKLPQDGPQKLQTYFGYVLHCTPSRKSLTSYVSLHSYSFESFSTADTPYPAADKSWGGDVNTNVQWAGVVRTSLGGIPMIVGGEVDCVHEGAGVETGLDVSAFVELKTNLVIEGPRDEMRFERWVDWVSGRCIRKA
jgi:hypothetical protein